MGRSYTPRYVIKINGAGRTNAVQIMPMEWRSRARGPYEGYGKPTEANLAKWVEKFNESLRPGGCNDHVGERAQVTKANIVDQFTNEVVATYEAPAFQVV